MSPGDRTRRFGPIRSTPPDHLAGARSAASRWTRSRVGDDGDFPNGGLWRFDSATESIFVKRTGRSYLGADPVWRLSVDDLDPQWWGREAAFYASDLARVGWGADCAPAVCLAIERRADEIDLWLEHVETVPLPLSRYETALRGLARWQAEFSDADDSVLSRGWLAQHVSRRRLDNAATARHPGWSRLLAAGLSERACRWAENRFDSAAVAAALRALPQLPTHHDFHHMNLGSNGDRVVILDWATVGWGPVGHDAANLVIDRAAEGDVDPGELWSRLLGAYGDELRASGVDIDQAAILRSAAVSSTIRMGWLLDFLLTRVEAEDPSNLLPMIPVANFLADLVVAEGPLDSSG
jgi:hypothetical protein